MKYEGTKIVYEVGDWVTCIDNAGSRANYKAGETFRVFYVDKDVLRSGSSPNTGMFLFRFRPATQEEINKATEEEKIMVGEYEVKFFQNAIEVGCVAINKELFLKIGKKAGWL